MAQSLTGALHVRSATQGRPCSPAVSLSPQQISPGDDFPELVLLPHFGVLGTLVRGQSCSSRVLSASLPQGGLWLPASGAHRGGPHGHSLGGQQDEARVEEDHGEGREEDVAHQRGAHVVEHLANLGAQWRKRSEPGRGGTEGWTWGARQRGASKGAVERPAQTPPEKGKKGSSSRKTERAWPYHAGKADGAGPRLQGTRGGGA